MPDRRIGRLPPTGEKKPLEMKPGMAGAATGIQMKKIPVILVLLVLGIIFWMEKMPSAGGQGSGAPGITGERLTAPGDTPVYRIRLSPNTRFWKGDTVFYQVNDVHSSGLTASLFDEQDADPLYGTDSPDPRTTFSSGYATRVYYPAVAVVDLGGYYKLTNEFVYNNWGTDSLFLLYGSPFNWSPDTLKIATGGRGWKDFGDTVYTRYLKVFYANKGYQKVRELILYGYLSGSDSLDRLNLHPAPPLVKTALTMGRFIGFNQIGPKEVDSVGSLMRHYLQQDWMDTVTATHEIDSIRFVFSKFGHSTDNTTVLGNNTNYFFPGAPGGSVVKSGPNLSSHDLYRMALRGDGYFDATQGVPVYARRAGEGKPIDRVSHPAGDAADPRSYDRLARMMWNYAAYYGAERHDRDSIQTPYPELSGLGLRAFVESGNEMNQDWSGRKNHYTPQEFMAYASAYYDGNLGKMGSRMGVKNADPGMQVIMAGTAGASIDYLKALHYYAYYTRADHSAPFDVLNFHVYPSAGSNGRGSNAYAFSPEEYFGNRDNPVRKYLAAARELFPATPVWLTEWGYDRNRKTKISVPPVAGLDSAQIQAQWIARFWLLLSFTGVERSTIFQLRNDPLKTLYDSAGYTTFNTTGLTDGHYVGDAYSPGINATSWYAFPAYYFQRTIWLGLYHYKPDSILCENRDSIWVYRYRNENHPDSVAYAIWSGTKTNRVVNKYALKTGHPNTAVTRVVPADKHLNGLLTTFHTDARGGIPLTITETPQLLFTREGPSGGTLAEKNK